MSQKASKGAPFLPHVEEVYTQGAYNLDLSMKSMTESTVVNLPSSLASRLGSMKTRLEEGSGINVLSPH